MKTYVRSSNDRDSRFQQDLNSAVYNAIADVSFKYRDLVTNEDDLRSAVDTAVEWWDLHFFESDDWEG